MERLHYVDRAEKSSGPEGCVAHPYQQIDRAIVPLGSPFVVSALLCDEGEDAVLLQAQRSRAQVEGRQSPGAANRRLQRDTQLRVPVVLIAHGGDRVEVLGLRQVQA